MMLSLIDVVQVNKIRNIALLFAITVFSVSCSKDINRQEHHQVEEISGLKLLEDKVDPGELEGPISFTPENDAKLLEAYRLLPKYNSEINKMKAFVSKKLQDQTATIEVLGEKVLSKDSAKEVSTQNLTADFSISTFNPLAEVILNKNFVSNENFNSNDKLRRILSAFNEALVLSIQLNSEEILASDFLEKYWGLTVVGCRELETVELKACRGKNLEFFRTDHNTARIFQIYANQVSKQISIAVALRNEFQEKLKNAESMSATSDIISLARADLNKAKAEFYKKVKKYYQIITVASVMPNQSAYVAKKTDSAITEKYSSDSIDILYLNHAGHLMEYLETLSGGAARRSIEAHVDSVKNTINGARNKLQKDAAYVKAIQKILSETDFWGNYSRNNNLSKSNWNPDLLQLAANSTVLAGTDLSSTINKKLLKESANEDEQGLLTQVKTIKAKSAAKGNYDNEVISNLEVDINFQANEYVFLIDRLFRKDWGVEDASAFWSGFLAAKLNKFKQGADREVVLVAYKKELLRTVDMYVKFQLLRMILKTNDFMGRVFSNKEQNVSTRQMFDVAIRDSEQIGNEWRAMLGQFDDIKTFTKRFTKEANNQNDLPEYKKIDQLFGNMKKNISLVSVYPNMLALALLMAKEKIPLLLPTWWGEVLELQADIVFNWLFAQITQKPPRPWFNFGNENKSIQKYENLYSLLYALKTKTFDTIQSALNKNGKNIVMDEAEFFSTVIEKITDSDKMRISNYILELETKYRSNSNYRKTLEICEAIEQAKENNSGRPSYSGVKINLEGVTSNTFVKSPSFSSVLDIYATSGNGASGHVQTLWENRLFLASSISFINTLIKISEKHWSQLEEAETDPEKKLKLKQNRMKALAKIDASFAEVKDYKKRLYSKLLELYSSSRNCLDTLYQVEKEQQYALYDFEIARLRDVHGKLKQLRALEDFEPKENASEEEKNAWKAKVASKEAELNTEIRSDAYLYEKGDVVGYDRVSLKDGYISANWDLMLRLANNLKKINPNISISRPPLQGLEETSMYQAAGKSENQTTTPYDDNEDVFINNAMKNINGNFLKFYSNWDLDPFISRFQLMLELYLAKELKIYEEDFKKCEFAVDGVSEPKCELKDVPGTQITARELSSEWIKLAEIMNVDMQVDAPYMFRLGVSKKYTEKNMSLFLEEGSKKAAPLFDNFYKKLLEKVYYLVEAKLAIGTLEDMRSSSEDSKNSENVDNNSSTAVGKADDTGELIFLSDKDIVRQSALEIFEPLVDGTFSAIENFTVEIDSKAKLDATNQKHYVFELDLNNLGKTITEVRPETDSEGKLKYLSDSRRGDFVSLRKNFHSDTKYRFIQYKKQKGNK